MVSTDVRSFWCRGPLGKNENDGDFMVPVAENKRKKNKVGGGGRERKKSGNIADGRNRTRNLQIQVVKCGRCTHSLVIIKKDTKVLKLKVCQLSDCADITIGFQNKEQDVFIKDPRYTYTMLCSRGLMPRKSLLHWSRLERGLTSVNIIM